MMKYLRHMVVFVQIVESGSISQAAKQLNLSKSVVSQMLSSLEEALDVHLLNRTTRRQVLTPAGQTFFKQCKEIQTLSDQAWQETRESQKKPRGPITISAPHALVDTVVAPAVGRLVASCSHIEPTLVTDDERVNLYEKGIDLAIRVGEMPSSDYRQRKLGSFCEILCASPEYTTKNALSPDIILNQDRTRSDVDYIANIWQGHHVLHRCRHNATQDEITFTIHANRMANTLPAVIALAKAGAGLALIPDFLFAPLQEKRQLVNILPEYTFSSVPVYAIHAFGHQPPALVKSCISVIKEEMAGLSKVSKGVDG
ncbi:MAG: LysR family transcriptional regulator [Endozoicomonas sp.]|uniref:LysR family transcriptional regulator n=1 Tax=Endozoicomonas sp. TaxID=1892382 RepID=UPI003D9BC210